MKKHNICYTPEMNQIVYLTPIVVTNLSYLNVNLLLLQFIFNENNVKFDNLITAKDYINFFRNYPNKDLKISIETGLYFYLNGTVIMLSTNQNLKKLIYNFGVYNNITGPLNLYSSTIENPSCTDNLYTVFKDEIFNDSSYFVFQLQDTNYRFQLKPRFSDDKTFLLYGDHYCNFEDYSSSLNFGVQLSVTLSYSCFSETIEDRLCRPFVCRDAHSCFLFFDIFSHHCENNLSSDFCFGYVTNFLKYDGPCSQMDNVLESYCKNKRPSEIFNDGSSRDFLLCACHMSDAYYTNFSDFAQNYANSQGYGLHMGISDICSFPPCTISEPSYPYTGPKCFNNVCYDIEKYNDDGTVEGIKLIVNSGCFGKINRATIRDFSKPILKKSYYRPRNVIKS